MFGAASKEQPCEEVVEEEESFVNMKPKASPAKAMAAPPRPSPAKESPVKQDKTKESSPEKFKPESSEPHQSPEISDQSSHQ